jgi:alkane 1-monooxygenase
LSKAENADICDMIKWSTFKYLIAFIPAILFIISINIEVYGLTLLWVYGLVQVLDFLSKESNSMNSDTVEQEVSNAFMYDLIIWLSIPVQYIVLYLFLETVSSGLLTSWNLTLITLSYGMCAAIYGINVAHELGHRSKKMEQWMAKLLLLTAQYTHFTIEHNFGHHKHVGTDHDAASAKLNENVYFFVCKSVFYGYISAWDIERKRLRNRNLSFWTLDNGMIVNTLLQLFSLGLIVSIYDIRTCLFFMIGAFIAVFFLEAINYIQHYGLRRQLKSDGSFEKVQLWHSWNSNFPYGRLALFELSRHSDHHDKSQRKYQALRPYPECPQLPTGYPGMVILALFPPIFFRVMNSKIRKLQDR